eukprot:TRINITY_DN25639_c0_g2_i1.p1 TRINITY_DN25639_c0_g2~~TRINITY_DN25639_c0_g2_i1.p1  ORF type:complete len:242 (+),score=40.71 TRINITY_DN25639_c0_g2_i1:97-822(+)
MCALFERQRVFLLLVSAVLVHEGLATPSDLKELAATTNKTKCSAVGKAYNDTKVHHPNGPAVINAELCQHACRDMPGCAKFTYYVSGVSVGYCWLLGAQAAEFDYPTAVSGPKYCPDDPPFSVTHPGPVQGAYPLADAGHAGVELAEAHAIPGLALSTGRNNGIAYLSVSLVTLGVLGFAYAGFKGYRNIGSRSHMTRFLRTPTSEEAQDLVEPGVNGVGPAMLVPVPAMGFEVDMETDEV